jgi:hypothetical protein
MAIFRMRRDDRGEWRWSFVADNGRTMAVSAEGYATKAGCVAAIRLLQNRGPQAPVSERGPAEEVPEREAAAVSVRG